MSNKECEEDKKSEDKLEIEVEEREKMLNEENEQKTVEKSEENDTNAASGGGVKPVVLEIEEGREVKPKKIPIGGIKMPGFFTRSRSKEKCKDEEEGEAGVTDDTNKTAVPENADENKSTFTKALKLPNFLKVKKKEPNVEEGKESQTETGNRRNILESIRLPATNAINNVLPRIRHLVGRNASGPTTQAGLASAETLGDFDKTDDGMESIKLDNEKTEDVEKQPTIKEELIEKVKKHRIVVGSVALFLLLIVIILIISLSGPRYIPTEAPLEDGKYVTAVTSCGKVQGILEDGAFAFRGIPYAVPPIDTRRWTPAAPLDNIDYCWNGTFKAHNATPTCWQLYSNGSSNGIESCLTLDVVTPYVRYDNPIPVVVLIGAESFSGDSPSKMRPSARYARSRDVIFVRPNFRVGVLGFLAANPLTQATHPPSSGNYGLSDILQALKWIQLNIEHFGGDKESVTLFGHRTGATLVTALATSIKSKGLFSKVWATSGSALFPGKLLLESEKLNKAYLDNIQCDNITCLRSKDVEELLDAVPDTWRRNQPDLPKKSDEVNSMHEWLVLDGDILREHLVDVWRDNKPAVKLVLGTTAHASASNKLFLKHTEWTPELIKEHVETSLLGELKLAEEALKLYNETYKGLAAMISDIRTVCPLLALSSQLEDVTFYVANMTRGELGNEIADVDTDVAAILGRYEAKTPEQRRYVSAMQQLFYHFVWHGTISQAANNTNKVLVVEQDTLPETSFSHCDFWIKNDIVPKYATVE